MRAVWGSIASVSVVTPEKQIVFVCWGNICRSPMAERVAQQLASARGLTGVRFSSAATTREEIGHAMDPRAQRALLAAGYRADGHRARQITAARIDDADLVLAMEQLHIDQMRRIAPEADNLALLTDYDPAAVRGAGIEDPWYGTGDGFVVTLEQIERAVAGLLVRLENGEL